MSNPGTAQGIRVLQVITSLAGGAGLHAVQLARHVDRQRFDLRLAFGAGYPLDSEVADEKLPHDVLRWTRSLAPISTARGTAQLAALIRRERPHIVHAHCSLAGALGRALASVRAVPRIVFTVHAFASRDHQPAWRQRLYLAAERGLDAFTDHYCVTTRSFWTQLQQRRIARAEKISIIPLGIEIPALPSARRRERARRELGLAPGALAIGTAARLEEQKGLCHLIAALPRVRRRAPNAELLILGDGPLRPALEAQARALGCGDAVRFLGWRPDAQSLLPGLDVFCVPSLWESFSYSLIEAMAAGVPAVASDTDALPEVLGGGARGVLVPPADPEALASALSELLRSPERREALRQAARQHVESQLDVHRMARAHGELYRALLASPAARRVRPARS